ncbi:hypothetical protein [Parvularcula marina]|uniref:Uncharacterized protein n=1 Tax=Parvularcula marina TaxID=2292771 RepID=A0A371RLG6_9PROT|nr:hypothetical protein [Parvularcula marina]RFB06216.1 hypothetical protein DX908_13640 [Parvularcula marina]
MTERTPPKNQNQIDLRDKAVEEATGGNGPRASRFKTGENAPEAIREKERKARADQMMALQVQLATQAQIDAYLRSLSDLRDSVYDAIEENADFIERLRGGAAKLEDGTAVYLLADGRFRTVEGDILTRDELADVPDNPTTWAEYEAAIQRRAQLARIESDVIAPAEDKLRSGEATTDDLKRIEAEMKEAVEIIENPAKEAADVRSETRTAPSSNIQMNDISLAP